MQEAFIRYYVAHNLSIIHLQKVLISPVLEQPLNWEKQQIYKLIADSPIAYLTLRGWQYAGRCRKAIIAFLVLFSGSQLICLAEPYVIGKLLNIVQADVSLPSFNANDLLRSIYLYLGLFLLIKLVFWAMHGPGRVIQRLVAFQVRANYRKELFRFITTLPMQWHREHHSGESIDKVSRATASLSDYYDSDIYELSRIAIQLVGTEIILICFMPQAGIVAALTTTIALLAICWFDKVLFQQYKTLNRFENSVASAVHDYVTNVISVIALRLEKPVVKEVRRRIQLSFPLFKQNVSMHEFKWFVTSTLIAVMIVLVLGWYAWSVLSTGHKLLGGTFFILFDYLGRIGNSFYSLTGLYSSLVKRAADLRGAESLHEAFNAVEPQTANSGLPRRWNEIKIRSLNFTYRDEKYRTHHLENINLSLARGKAIALVGESGSGKSTLLNLLRGLQTTEHVIVECDGRPLAHGLNHLKSTTTLMPQDPEIFADTIRFNLTFGLEGSEQEITSAARMARFEQVLERLPFGLDTNISEKGVNLSGGEKQRLALARGIYFSRESDIILLDEPTSSIDTFNERAIYRNLLRFYEDRCLISSIHKLHLLELFDEIYVFEKGRIVERGTLTNLLRSGGLLAQMWADYQSTDGLLALESGNTVRQTVRAAQ